MCPNNKLSCVCSHLKISNTKRSIRKTPVATPVVKSNAKSTMLLTIPIFTLSNSLKSALKFQAMPS